MTELPEFRLDQHLAASSAAGGTLAVTFQCRSADGRDDRLVAVYEWQRRNGAVEPTRFLVTDQVGAVGDSPIDIVALADTLQAPLFGVGAPARLAPVHIPKPWGQEIWFTGIEQRGVSAIGDGQHTVPLPWYLQALPGRLAAGRAERINLLKILDPLPEPVLGDLYFELHHRKQEVYVVTAVDPVAWPAGRGAIRLGFDPGVRAEHDSEASFRAAYRDAVLAYRQVRLEIDTLIDRKREAEGVGLHDPVEPAVQRRWLAAVPEPLAERERRLRAAMDSYTRLWPLEVGDVVQVPLQTPHALQHGVRTVEFQTPVYERSILSFGQKVLTQPHWDTDAAVAVMQLDVESLSQSRPLARGVGWLLDRIVTFDDFVVDRLTLDSGAIWSLDPTGEYGLAMCIGAGCELGDLLLAHEEACFLPAGRSELRCANRGNTSTTLLIAAPR